MKFFVIITMTIISFGIKSKVYSAEKMLTTLKKCQDSESLTKQYLAELKDETKLSSVQIAYKAALESLMAKHAFNPFTKMEYLKKSNVLYQKSFEKDSNNIEMRFLRFNTQSNLPAVFRKNELIQTDVLFLNKVLENKNIDVFLKKAIQESLDSFKTKS